MLVNALGRFLVINDASSDIVPAKVLFMPNLWPNMTAPLFMPQSTYCPHLQNAGHTLQAHACVHMLGGQGAQ